MSEFNPIELDMRVRSITKVERQKEDSDTVIYRLLARDKEGVNEITITSASPFAGLSAKTGLIQVILKNSQMTLEEFDDGDEEDEEDQEEMPPPPPV